MKEVITKLAIGDTLSLRLSNAFSELEVIHKDDVTPLHFQKISDWKSEYINMDKKLVNNKGDFEAAKNMEELARELLLLVFEIFETNSKLCVNE